MMEYTICVRVSAEGTMAMNNPRVDSIEKLRPLYEQLLREHGGHDKLILSVFYDGQRSDISFSDLEKLSDMICELKR